MTSKYLHTISKGIKDTYMDSDESEIEEIRKHFSEKKALETVPPWVDVAGVQIWNNSRVRVAKVVLTNRFEIMMGIIIATNFFAVIYETDRDGTCYPKFHDNYDECPTSASKLAWLWYLNLVFLIIYSVEAAVRAFVFRIQYCYDKWNYLDLFIVLSGWLQETMGGHLNLAMLRMFRLARLFRAFRIFFRSRELYLLVNGFASSCRAIFFGMLMLFAMLILFSILMVELVHPVNSQVEYGTCSDCSSAFNSVVRSSITLFKEIVAGGSWMISYQVMQRSPWLGIVLVMVVAIVSLGTMNLILSVIVERASEAREKDVADRIQQKDEEASEMKLRLLKLCSTMDKDNSRTLTADELHASFEDLPDFRNVLKLMHIGKKDLNMVFELMDSDSSGSVDYKEFCEELYLLSLTDQRWALASTKHKIDEMRKAVDSKLETFLTHFNARSESQEKQLHGIQSMLNKLTPSFAVSTFPFTPAGVEKGVDANVDLALSHFGAGINGVSKQLDTIDLKVSKLMATEGMLVQSALHSSPPAVPDPTDDYELCTDLEINVHHDSVQSAMNLLGGQMQRMCLSQHRAASKAFEQAGALQQQAEFVTRFCESVSAAEKQSFQAIPEKGSNPFSKNQSERVEILMVQGNHLGHLLNEVEREVVQLGFYVDRSAELMVVLAKAFRAFGLGSLPFDLDRLSPVSSI